ncbi:MAG: AraC family transcriptional regulator [Acidobacteriota bacterium]
MIDFGWRSGLIALGVVQGAVVALLLLFRRRNRQANRLLAALLALVGLSQMPQILGFAGFYRAYPWLTFAPFEVPWSFGPLIYLYPFRLIHGRLPRRWGWLFLPAVLQFGYYAYHFLFLSLEQRYAANQAYHAGLFLPAETVLSVLSVGLALGLSIRRFRRYQRWLPQEVSDRENYRLPWLRNFLLGLALCLGLVLIFEGYNLLVESLAYVQIYPMHLGVALAIYYFGIEGYRHAEVSYPAMPMAATPAEAPSREPDWRDRVAPWIERLEAEKLYLDPSLSLASLARHFQTNTHTLSRAINQGLDSNFNDLVNGYRVAAVQARLADPKDDASLLDVALAAGFNSKTSFNRSFKRHTGTTPSAWRRQSRHPGEARSESAESRTKA